MKKTVFILLSVLCVFCAARAYAQTITEGGLVYNIDGNTAQVVGFDTQTDTIILKSVVQGARVIYNHEVLSENIRHDFPEHFKRIIISQDVQSVPERFGSYLQGINEIVFEGAPRVIGQEAFCYLSDVKQINLPEGVEVIGDYTFIGLIALERIELPATLSSLGDAAFADSYSLKTLAIAPSNPTYQLLEGSLYTRGADQTLVFAVSPDRDVFTTAPGTVKIGRNAFNWFDIKTLVIGEGVEVINDNAFSGLYALHRLCLPQSLRVFDVSLQNNPEFEEVTVAPGNAVFESRKGVLYANGIPVFIPMANSLYVRVPFFGQTETPNLLSGNSKVAAISVDFGYESISEVAFDGCLALQTVSLPLGIKHIGGSAFNGCASLERVSFPPTLETIGPYAFWRCVSLKNIIIPHGVKRIESHAFGYCGSITRISIPDSVEYIENNAFNGCPKDAIVVGEPYSAAYFFAYSQRLRFQTHDGTPYYIKDIHTFVPQAGILRASDANTRITLYERAESKSPQRATYRTGTTALILEEGSAYTKVRVGNQEGYVENEYFLRTTELTNGVPLIWGKVIGISFYNEYYTVYDTPDEASGGTTLEGYPQVNILGTCGTMYYVYVNGKLGYMPTNALDVGFDAQTQQTGQRFGVVCNPDSHDRLHLRKEPSTKSASLGRYYNGTQVQILDYSGQWYHVKVDGKEGYMLDTYVREMREILPTHEWDDFMGSG
ncbi:MAG: leucine-rich repeat protein [Clostridia bacterium]|nr:leucine-rich repeat protein [Clostridia bacterium]